MLYKAKNNLSVGQPDLSTRDFKSGEFYKISDLEGIDLSNFTIMTEQEAENDLASRKRKPLTPDQKGAAGNAAPAGDLT